VSQVSNLRAAAKTVLLVEDDPLLLDMLAQTLQTGGVHSRYAVHGADALTQMRTLDADIVVTDILMPANGRLRADPHAAGKMASTADCRDVRHRGHAQFPESGSQIRGQSCLVQARESAHLWKSCAMS